MFLLPWPSSFLLFTAIRTDRLSFLPSMKIKRSRSVIVTCEETVNE